MKENETGGAWVMLLAVLTVLGKWKMFQSWGDKLSDLAFRSVEKWLTERPKRQLLRRLPDDEINQVLLHEAEEVETLILILKAQHNADRVTLIEFEWPKDVSQPALATCLHEQREPRVSAIRQQYQKRPLEAAIQAWVQEIFGSPSRCCYIPDTARLENTTVRSQLLRFGVRSAYYLALPDSSGRCGALLTMSWATPTPVSAADQAALQNTGRILAALQRTLWACQPAPAPVPA